MTAALQGKVLADKSYLPQSLLERLWQRGLHLVTGIRRTMKNHLLEHTRHRSPSNVLVHILSCLAATTLAQPKGNIGKIPIPMDTIPCPSRSYPQLGFRSNCRAFPRWHAFSPTDYC
ncbi:MAG: hypothetical protein F4218_00805 [Synechococcus sp. SB0677_bin_5]|nr:hypothetical protein [Synechococcus sp. SB0677_bin_5]